MTTLREDVWYRSNATTLIRHGRADNVEDGFQHRVTKPLATGGSRNVGPRVGLDPADFTVVNSDMDITSANAHYDHLWVNGHLEVHAAGVTIDDLVVRTPYTTTARNGLYVVSGSAAITFADIGVQAGAETYNQTTGVRGRNFTLKRSHVHGFIDATMPYGASPSDYAIYEDCVLECGPHYANPPDTSHTDGSHSDACQCEGNVSLSITGCSLFGGYTSCLLLTNNVAGGYGYAVAEDNWLDKYESVMGAFLNISAADVNGLSMKRNRVSRGTVSGRIVVSATNKVATSFGMVGTTGNCTGWTPGADCNVFEDNGAPVYPQ